VTSAPPQFDMTVERSSGAPSDGTRDSFLDVLRAVSICRVVVLHTLLRPGTVYLPWVMWIYPGMPEVFFVSGAVTAHMLSRRRATDVVARRVRRIALPYLWFALCALAVMIATDVRSDQPGASFPWAKLWHWAVPLFAPTGSRDRVFLWGQLWYVGAFLWLVLAATGLLWLHRRVGAWCALLPLAGFACTQWLSKIHGVVVDEAIVTALQFGIFFALGPSYARLRLWSSGRLLGLGCGFGALGVLTAFVIEPIRDKGTQELYASRSAHLLIGAAWMLAALSARRPIERWIAAHRASVHAVVGRINTRTFTMYLWGLPANAVANSVSRRIDSSVLRLVAYLGLTAGVLWVFVVCFGQLEDVASRRPRRWIPKPGPLP
jgi:peptidoglycan/LPS O-acetylase OafA/YrhL